MKVQGALIKEQGITFAIVVVKKHIVDCANRAAEAIDGFSRLFPGSPIVLMAQDSRGRQVYRGRRDIVRFLSKVSPARIPWKEFTFR